MAMLPQAIGLFASQVFVFHGGGPKATSIARILYLVTGSP